MSRDRTIEGDHTMDSTEAIATLEIQQVMSRYERHFDKHELEPLLDLFVEGCRAEYGGTVMEGKAELEEFIEGSFAGETGVEDSFHMVMNPWIEVDGDRATGRWHFLGAYTLASVGAAWLTGFYEVSFRREDGDWRIETLEFEEKWTTPYEDGWAETPRVER